MHRLLQNFEDGKIVEGIDPRLLEEERCRTLLNDGLEADSTTLPLTALERSTIPTYSSSAEDDEALHRKLEGFAGQYYILLKSQSADRMKTPLAMNVLRHLTSYQLSNKNETI